MPRPKSAERTWSHRLPEELMSDIDDAARQLGVTRSEYVKQAIELKLKLPWVIQADWYTIRRRDPWSLGLRCVTVSDMEEPKWRS